jgi:RsiW-degrading membrane proteinase PrsW (M82 family)
MNEQLLIKLLHLLGFAYWLGGDVGVFYSSFHVANEKHSPATRAAIAKILFTLDQLPRICMTLMLPLGVHLAWRMGLLPLSTASMVTIWLIGFAWLALVVKLHALETGDSKRRLTTLDFWFRIILGSTLIIGSLIALVSDTANLPNWLALKLAIFGGLIGLGLILRIKLRPFVPAFANIAAGTASDVDNAVVRDSLESSRPFVVAIWVGLIASAALGIHLI